MSSAARKIDRVTLAPIQGRRLSRARNGSAAPAEADPTRLPNFVAGPENHLLVAVINRLIASIEEPAAPTTGLPATTPNPLRLSTPLVLTGPTGSGKTHLACGLADLWRARRGEDEVAYYTAADFSRALAGAIADGAVRDFRRRLRRKRLVVIDDAHRLGATKNKAAELRHTIDGVSEAGGLMLLTLSGPAADAPGFDRPLLSRLAGGLAIEIAPPGLHARRELLRQAADAAGCKLDDRALETLAEQLPPEPPRMLRAAVELRRRQGVRIDAQAARQLLEDDRPDNSPPLRDILRVVARYHQVPLNVLTSASRKQGVVAARAVAIYLARELTPMSYADIGRLLGGRDHTTIMHNYRRIDRELTKDRALQSAVQDLRRLLSAV